MRKLLPLLFIEAALLLILMSLFSLDTGRSARAETSYPDQRILDHYARRAA